MWERVSQIIKKEFRQTLREPRMRAMLFLPPILQLLIFGYAVNMDIEEIRMGWMDQDNSPASRDLRDSFSSSGRFKIVARPGRDSEAEGLLADGSAQGVIRILPEFARDLERGSTAAVQVLIDGTNSNTASIVSSYATTIINNFGTSQQNRQMQKLLMGKTQVEGGAVDVSTPQLTARSRVWFNPDLKSRNFYVPGVVVNMVTLLTLMLTAMAIVREKEMGTMEQLMVTPIQPLELILGKTLPFAAVGLFDTILMTSAALLVFDVPFRGGLLLMLVCSILFLLTTLGAGLFISTISQTQQQAMMSSFFFFMPTFMLSGFAFPIRNMPVPVQYLTYLNPVRYFMEIIRNLFLKGSGVAILWPQMLALFLFGVAILGLSVLRFHKRLD
jgi:ABC-2 type transport system permease protein